MGDGKHSQIIAFPERRGFGTVEYQYHEEGIEDEQSGAADESPFLRPNTKNKITVTGGKVMQLVVFAVSIAFSPEPTGSDGNFCLGHLITTALTILFRM